MTCQEIVITAQTPLLAVEQLLSAIMQDKHYPTDERGSFLLGFNGEAAGIAAAIECAIQEIADLTAEHDAVAVGCEVSGLQETDEGFRLWGTIECVSSPELTARTTRVDQVTLEQQGTATWRLAAQCINKEPS